MWAIAKRISLFILLNILVVSTLSLASSLLGLRPYLTRSGLDLNALAAFCLLWGMGGALISLALSRLMAKWMMGVQLVDPLSPRASERALVQTVHRLAAAAGLTQMPEVGIWASPEVNAFATGPSRSRALVAVSTGLLAQMQPDEIEGVLGHELAHVANGDMVTMTLLQGVVNAFAMFLARAIAYAVASGSRNSGRDGEGGRSEGGASAMAYMLQWALEMVFMVLGSLVVAWFSRMREFRADAGGAELAGRDRMVRALKRLQLVSGLVDPRDAQQGPVQTLKISGQTRGLMALFATHPPLSDRIEALRQLA